VQKKKKEKRKEKEKKKRKEKEEKKRKRKKEKKNAYNRSRLERQTFHRAISHIVATVIPALESGITHVSCNKISEIMKKEKEKKKRRILSPRDPRAHETTDLPSRYIAHRCNCYTRFGIWHHARIL
jgi:hypothetical protein